MISESAMLQRPWVRIAPHFIDTLLLISAVSLTLILEQYPLVNSWLTAKFLALIVYILLGTIALKRGRTKAIRIAAFITSIGIFIYIVMVALSHDPAAVTVFLVL